MRVTIPAVLAVAVMGCAAKPSQPQPEQQPQQQSSTEEETQKAGSYAGSISAWRQHPEVWRQQCERVDPQGSAQRLKAKEAWEVANKEELTRADSLVRRAADRALPESAGVDRGEAFRAAVFMRVSQTVYFMDAAKKTEMCKHYADLPFFHEPAAAWRTEAYDYLDKWLSSSGE